MAKVTAAWDGRMGRLSAHSDGPEPTPCPFPTTDWISTWAAVSWRAFGTLDTPAALVKHRSFDQGTSWLPDNTDVTLATRQDQHRKFDDAGREVIGLLATGRALAKGQRPACTASREKLHVANPEYVDIPASTFLNQNLAFGPQGELIARAPLLERLFPPYALRGSDADPRFPQYHDVLIGTAGLRDAWQAADGGMVLPVLPHFDIHHAGPLNYPAVARRAEMPYWTATEVLTLIAFGQPEKWEALIEREHTFEHQWRANPPDDVLRLLEARAARNPFYTCHQVIFDNLPGQPPQIGTYRSVFASPRAPALARAIRADHRGRLDRLLTYSDLALMLRVEIDEREHRATQLREANRVLWDAIRRGQLTAYGVPANNPTSLHQALPREFGFLPLRFWNDQTEPGEVSTATEWHEVRSKPRYVSVRFDREQVQAAELRQLPEDKQLSNVDVLPDAQTITGVQPTATYSASALAAWFILRVKSWRSDKSLPSDADDYEAACAYFGSMPRGSFRDIRRDKTPPEWRKPGPRRPRN